MNCIINQLYEKIKVINSEIVMGNILDKMKAMREQAEKERLERKRKEEEFSNSVLESQGLDLTDPKEILNQRKGWFSEAMAQTNRNPSPTPRSPPPPINQFKARQESQPQSINSNTISTQSNNYNTHSADLQENIAKNNIQSNNKKNNVEQTQSLYANDLDDESIDFSDIDLFEDDILDINKEQEYLEEIEKLKVEAETAKSQKYEIMLQYQNALDKASELATTISQQEALISQYKENLDKQKELSNVLREKVKDLTEKINSAEEGKNQSDLMGEIEEGFNESQRMYDTLMGKTSKASIEEPKEETNKISDIVKDYQDKIEDQQNQINRLESKVKKLESRKSKIQEIKRLTRENQLLKEKVDVLQKQAGGDKEIQSLIIDYERKIKRLKIELKKARNNQ